MAQQQRLVVGEEGRRLGGAFIPQQRREASAPEQPQRLTACLVDLEPVKGLAGDQQIDTGRRQRGSLRRALHAAKARPSTQACLGSCAHGVVRLDPDDLRPAREQQLGEDPGAGADIRHHGGGR